MKFDMREEWLRNVALYFCLCITIAIRVWLLVHTRGVIDGDEALVGIQAQHILQGERPIYFYGQVYMGSLEAYLVALLFALFGSSAWLLLIASTDTHPQFLNQLDQAHIIYHVERFSSEPGVDLIVVTPINRSIPITTNPLFYGMFVCHK